MAQDWTDLELCFRALFVLRIAPATTVLTHHDSKADDKQVQNWWTVVIACVDGELPCVLVLVCCSRIYMAVDLVLAMLTSEGARLKRQQNPAMLTCSCPGNINTALVSCIS